MIQQHDAAATMLITENTHTAFQRRIFGPLTSMIFLITTVLSCVVPTIPTTGAGSGASNCTLVVNVADVNGAAAMAAAARTVVPSFAGSAKSYTITCTKAGDTPVVQTMASLAAQTFQNLSPGTYTITVNSYNSSSTQNATTLIATGSSTVTLTEGAAATAYIQLKYAQTSGTGQGTFTLTIKWPAASANQIWWYLDGSSTPTILTASSTPAIVTDANGISSVTLSATKPSGIHTVRINFNKDGSTGTGSQLEIVNVYDNMVSDQFVGPDGSLSSFREYSESEVMDMGDSVNTGVSVRVIEGDAIARPSLVASGSVTLPVRVNAVTVIPTIAVPGQRIEISQDGGTTFTQIASDMPVSLTLPTKTDINNGAGTRDTTVKLKVTPPNNGTPTTYTLVLRSPVHVTTYNMLAAALAYLDNNVILDADITLPATSPNWTPIGAVGATPNTNQSLMFNGTLNGNGHTITGLNITTTDGGAGMFCAIGSKAIITGVRLKDVTVDGGTTMTNGAVGGLAGENYGGTISRCSVSGTVKGYQWVGGLVGNNRVNDGVFRGSISECYSTAKVRAQNAYSGGLVGGNWGTITDCYARAVVYDCNYSAGLVGGQDPLGKVINCYSSSVIYTNDPASWKAGLVYGSGTCTGSYYNKTLARSETDTSFIDTFSGAPKTTGDMKTASTYSDWNMGVSWEIDPAKNSGYPYLRYVAPETIHINAASMDMADFRALVQNNLEGDFVLDQNLTLTGGDMTPIGNTIVNSALVAPFMGTFDGNGKTISNVSINVAAGNAGFFACVGDGSIVKNLRLENVTTTGTTASSSQVGALAGTNKGLIYRCSSSGTIIGANSVGGLIGDNKGTIEECWSNATVTASFYSGGLVGSNGENGAGKRTGLIKNCYARGAVTVHWGGGLVGSNNDQGSVVNSYAAGLMSHSGTIGGDSFVQVLIGNSGGAQPDCFFDSSKIATSYKAGVAITSGYFGTPKDFVAMRTESTFTDANWDFSTVWTITAGKNGGYPHLRNTTPTTDTTISATSMAATDFKALIETNLNGDYYLSASTLTLTGTMTSIGGGTKFTGVFDGGGHVIANAQIVGGSYAALFGLVSGAVVNLNLRNVTVTQTNAYNYTGGLAGYNAGVLYRCSSAGFVSGYKGVGGLVGENYGLIKECYSAGSVYGRDETIGGLVGYTNSGFAISDCYARCAVSGTTKCGGIVGCQSSNVTTSYAAGIVTATATSPASGGLSGYHYGSAGGPNCFYDSSLTSGGSEAYVGTATSNTNMKNLATFKAAGWDFDNVWAISPSKNSGYPYLIHNAPPDDIIIPDGTMSGTAFNALFTDLGANYILGGDVTLTTTPTPISPFTGSFDGNNHTITITSTASDTHGLFEVNSGLIQNLHVSYPNGFTGSTSGDCSGGIVGYNGGTIYRCSASGNFTGSRYYLGGITGSNHGTIRECYSVANLGGVSYVGGIAGDNVGYIGNCYNRGSVSGSSGKIGGITGDQVTSTAKIVSCYSTGSISGLNDKGGLIGYYSAGGVTNCFYDTDTSGMSDTGKGTPYTNTEMRTIGKYSGWDIDSGQNTSKVWGIDYDSDGTAGYPFLQALPVPDDIFLSGTISAVTLSSQMNGNLGKSYILADNVTLTGEWTPVGTAATPFTGAFDGSGHTITGLDIQISTANSGMFAYSEGIIENVTVANASVKPKAGEDYKDTIAILVAINTGTIRRCAATGTTVITGNGYIGAMAGINQGTISECYSTVPIDAHSWYAGGLVGANHGSGLIANCYSRGAVSVAAPAGYNVQYIGGLVGLNGGSITTSYTTGVITTSGTVSKVGGLVGGDGGVTASFYQTVPSGGNALGTQSSAMTTSTTYAGASWNLVTALNPGYIWGIDTSATINDSYPYLQYFGSATVSP